LLNRSKVLQLWIVRRRQVFAMWRTLALVIFAVVARAETRDFDKPCAALFPKAVQVMTDAHFEPKVSDAQGGVLTLAFTGAPMIDLGWHVGKEVNEAVARYVENGAKLKNKYYGLSFTKASFVFTTQGDGCRVQLDVALAAHLDNRPDVQTNGRYAWHGRWIEAKSNGAGEKEFLEKLQ
jgi:hypothetical protein